ncbi:MAG: hypothetical protein ACI4SZ_08065, partial [Lachnospiraceae bacterium]
MKKAVALLMMLVMSLSLVACGAKADADNSGAAASETTGEASADSGDTAEAEAPAEAGKVYNVCYLVNGNLGDKSFFDSCNAGLTELESAGRIKLRVIEMGGSDEDKPVWLSTLYEVSEAAEYDLIICGTYQ